MKIQTINSQKQRGAALIIGLTLLMALTIIGIGTLNTTSLEHRMVGNMADANIAFNAVESAARNTSLPLIDQFKAAGLPDCSNFNTPPCFQSGLAPSWWDDPNFWTTDPPIAFTDNAVGGVKSPPQLVIEDVRYVKDTLRLGHEYKAASGARYYRITTRATGLSNNSQAITQQVVKKRLN